VGANYFSGKDGSPPTLEKLAHTVHLWLNPSPRFLCTSVFQPFLWSGTLCINFDCSRNSWA